MPNISLVLNAALRQIDEPGFGKELTTKALSSYGKALEDGSEKRLWADPRTHTVMLRPRQLDAHWLDSTQQLPWIIRLAQMDANAVDLADSVITEHPAFGNTASPWIYHTQTSASDYYPAALPPLPGVGTPLMTGITPGVDPGALDTLIVRPNAGYELPTTMPAPPPAVQPSPNQTVSTTTGRFPVQSKETLTANQPLFLRWLSPPNNLGFPAVYRFYIGQFALDIKESFVQVFQDISQSGDRSAFKHVATLNLFSHSPAGLDEASISNNFQPLHTSDDPTYSQHRWLMWLPFRRHQVLLFANTGRSKLIQVRPTPRRLPDNSDWDIVRADKLLVWFLVPHWGRVQIQKLAFSTTPTTANFPPVTLDFVPAADPAFELVADQDHGTSITITQSTPPVYSLPINNANDCPTIPAGISSIQARQYGYQGVFQSSALTANNDASWTPFFYNLKLTRDPVLIAATTTPTTVNDTTASTPSGASAISAEFSIGLRPGEGKATVQVADHPTYGLQSFYYRSGQPVQIKTGATVAFTGYMLPPGLEPLKQSNSLARRVSFTAADRWYQLTRTYLRDNRDWSGVSHLTVVQKIMQQAGVDTTGMELPPNTSQYNQVLGIAGPADLTNMELDGRTNGPWQPRPAETAASFIQRIARHFSGYIVGFHADGVPFYVPRYFFTTSAVTLYESAAAATTAGFPGAPVFRRHSFSTIPPEAIIILVKAVSSQDGSPRFSSLWIDWAAIKNPNVVNWLGWPKTEVVTIWGSYSCAGINWAARTIWQQTRRRFLRVRFDCDYSSLIKVGHCLTLHGYGDYRVQSFRVNFQKSSLQTMTVEAEYIEAGFGLPGVAPNTPTG